MNQKVGKRQTQEQEEEGQAESKLEECAFASNAPTTPRLWFETSNLYSSGRRLYQKKRRPQRLASAPQPQLG